MSIPDLTGINQIVTTFYYPDAAMTPPLFPPQGWHGVSREKSRYTVLETGRCSVSVVLDALRQAQYYLLSAPLTFERPSCYSSRFLIEKRRQVQQPYSDSVEAFGIYAENYTWNLIGLRNMHRLWLKCTEPIPVRAYA